MPRSHGRQKATTPREGQETDRKEGRRAVQLLTQRVLTGAAEEDPPAPAHHSRQSAGDKPVT